MNKHVTKPGIQELKTTILITIEFFKSLTPFCIHVFFLAFVVMVLNHVNKPAILTLVTDRNSQRHES